MNFLKAAFLNLWVQDDKTQSELKKSSPPSQKSRKPGEAIGEDFDFSQVEIPSQSNLDFSLDKGSVYQVYERPTLSDGTLADTNTSASSVALSLSKRPIVNVPDLREYYIHLDCVHEIASDGPAKSFAYRRLQYLEGRYNLYTLLNEYEEVADTKKVPHRDFYNVRKVDTHVHHSACMNQKHLLRFIKSKMKKSPDEVVLDRDGKELTLKQVFESINLTAYDLSIDTLDMHVSSVDLSLHCSIPRCFKPVAGSISKHFSLSARFQSVLSIALFIPRRKYQQDFKIKK